ncbi:MAG: CesT family type III secretion system chaperone [Chlamydia sp.]
MITDRFSAILEELSSNIEIDVQPDQNNSCCIRYPDGMLLTLEPASGDDILYIVIEIATVPKGRYRENIFREALKANGLPAPRTGIFCYGHVKDMLLLYDALCLDELNGIRLLEIMNMMLEQARLWKSSIERGEIPSYRSNELTFHAFGRAKKNIFGFR